ncbi:hypothetical protein ABH904_000997 [Pseudomonas frederiksbergensis]
MPRSRDRGIFYWAVIAPCRSERCGDPTCPRRRPDSRPGSLIVYISVSAVMATYGFAFTASHFRKACAARRKVTKALLPRHSVPRLGSACPHSGIAPGGRRHRPSMAGGGYRGILAAVPPAQRLRSASGKGAADQDQKPKQRQRQDQQLREQARSHSLDWVTPGEGWSADRPPSQASQLPQLDWVHPGKIGRLTGRHCSDAATRQASSHKNQSTSALLFTTQQAER